MFLDAVVHVGIVPLAVAGDALEMFIASVTVSTEMLLLRTDAFQSTALPVTTLVCAVLVDVVVVFVDVELVLVDIVVVFVELVVGGRGRSRCGCGRRRGICGGRGNHVVVDVVDVLVVVVDADVVLMVVRGHRRGTCLSMQSSYPKCEHSEDCMMCGARVARASLPFTCF